MSVYIKIQMSKNKQHFTNHSHCCLWLVFFSVHTLFYYGEEGLCFIFYPTEMKLSTSIAETKKISLNNAFN